MKSGDLGMSVVVASVLKSLGTSSPEVVLMLFVAKVIMFGTRVPCDQ